MLTAAVRLGGSHGLSRPGSKHRPLALYEHRARHIHYLVVAIEDVDIATVLLCLLLDTFEEVKRLQSERRRLGSLAGTEASELQTRFQKACDRAYQKNQPSRSTA